jgi:hypothetical protein
MLQCQDVLQYRYNIHAASPIYTHLRDFEPKPSQHFKANNRVSFQPPITNMKFTIISLTVLVASAVAVPVGEHKYPLHT